MIHEKIAEEGVAVPVTARIGMVNFINVAPIYEIWKESVNNPHWHIVEDVPSGLNKRLLSGDVDMGFISSFAYGENPEKYSILPGLSISASGPVGSVFLFSHVPLEQLDGVDVLLSSQSATSVALTKVILEEFFKVKPNYSSGNTADAAESKEFQAVLTIGDDALKLVESSDYLYQFDLGDIWKRHTDLPFVFAVCAVRREFAEAYPKELYAIYQELIRCRKNGKEELDRICEVTAPRIPMSVERCKEYLLGIEYDLSSKKREAIDKFFSLLIKRGELAEQALPLHLFSYDPDS